MRLIDADKIELDYSGLAYISHLDFVGTAKYFTDQIKAAPTVDAELVKHGHWIENHYEFYALDENYKPVLLNGIGYKCNICNKDNEKTTDYCPNCGAKMMNEVSE